MGFLVIYDASVLYPPTLRDVLNRVAQEGMVHAKWTNRILDETFNAIEKTNPHLDPARLARTRELMGGAIRDCLVVGYEPLINAVELPDPDAVEVVRLDHRESTSQSHMDASVYMLGRADQLLAVWDGEPARGYGGTADVVDAAEQRGVPVTVIWPDGASRD
jgi:hypothetical protein